MAAASCWPYAISEALVTLRMLVTGCGSMRTDSWIERRPATAVRLPPSQLGVLAPSSADLVRDRKCAYVHTPPTGR